MTTVEDYRPGYPQFAALIGSHTSFHVCRRFLRVRARLLLLKQDELSVLESQLDQIDREETRELFLGNRRRDTNPERKEILTKLETALVGYGMTSFLFQKHRTWEIDYDADSCFSFLLCRRTVGQKSQDPRVR